MKKRVTLSFESKVYDDFQKHCEKEGWILSRKLEIWMENFLNELKYKKDKK
jgi:hypothetical protein